MSRSLSEMLRNSLKKEDKKSPPHVMITARAGCGKTSTLVKGVCRMRGIGYTFKPTDEEKFIWDLISESADAKSIHFSAFNASVVNKIKAEIEDAPGITASTTHATGFKSIKSRYPNAEVNRPKTSQIIKEIVEKSMSTHSREVKSWTYRAVRDTVSLCKTSLVDVSEEKNIAAIYEKYGFLSSMKIQEKRFCELVQHTMLLSLDVKKYGFDDDDMVWIPVIKNLLLPKYDLLLVDEAQDLSEAQQALLLRCGRRLILCGDPRQSIYGYAGVSDESMNKMLLRLNERGEAVVYAKLTQSWRCSKEVIKHAQQFVPDIRAREDAEDGEVHTLVCGGRSFSETFSDYAEVKEGDLIICRFNYPLIKICYFLIKKGLKVRLMGKNVFSHLTSFVNMTDFRSSETLLESLHRQLLWMTRNSDERKSSHFHDLFSCLEEIVLRRGINSKSRLLFVLSGLFDKNEDEDAVRLGSIHSVKGLEAERVYFLLPDYRQAREDWEIQQDLNLHYVGVTRAKSTLVYVKE